MIAIITLLFTTIRSFLFNHDRRFTQELTHRLGGRAGALPQVFLHGQHLGVSCTSKNILRNILVFWYCEAFSGHLAIIARELIVLLLCHRLTIDRPCYPYNWVPFGFQLAALTMGGLVTSSCVIYFYGDQVTVSVIYRKVLSRHPPSKNVFWNVYPEIE